MGPFSLAGYAAVLTRLRKGRSTASLSRSGRGNAARTDSRQLRAMAPSGQRPMGLEEVSNGRAICKTGRKKPSGPALVSISFLVPTFRASRPGRRVLRACSDSKEKKFVCERLVAAGGTKVDEP